MNPRIRASLVAVLSALGALLFGLDIGYIAPILECASFKRDVAHMADWQNPRSKIDDYTSGFIVGVFSLGCVVSSLPLLSSYFLDGWGRRNSIILGSAIFLSGSCMQVLSDSILMMLWGRFVSGLSIGLLSTVVSLYQSELAPSNLRGCLTSIYQLMITAGILLAALIDHGLVHREPNGWRWAISIQMVPAVALLLLMPFMPRSPRWLVQQGRNDEALEALRLVRDETEAESELAEIQRSHEEAKAFGDLHWRELLHGRARQLLLLGITLQILQQMSGMNAFMYFGPRIFLDIGFSPTVFQTCTSLVNFLATFPALLLADVCGRRSLLWWSALGMMVASTSIAAFGHAATARPENNTDVGAGKYGSYVVVSMVFFFVANFAYGWGPIVWVYSSEMFPLRYRSQCMAAGVCASWIANYAIAQGTPVLLGKLGFFTFYFFAVFALAALLLAQWLPETKGVMLEHVQRLFDEKFGTNRRDSSLRSKYGSTLLEKDGPLAGS
ncbi:putative glucose transporter rco-3 [Symbiodinium microadriaticum]|uniref:Hexose transporter 1 n=1 Tax=Symbiodinium microadriaticum TaxID=2951 RepID=A0A1Q9DX02_SYMMI|nr:putative glucose transporter rco-3 [Symbiodinium microadriaticum]